MQAHCCPGYPTSITRKRRKQTKDLTEVKRRLTTVKDLTITHQLQTLHMCFLPLFFLPALFGESGDDCD